MDGQQELFPPPQPRRKSEAERERSPLAIQRRLAHEFAIQRGARNRQEMSAKLCDNLLAELRGRTDAAPVISWVYWTQDIIKEERIAAALSCTVAQLQDVIIPVKVDTHCLDCHAAIAVTVRTREEHQRTATGRMPWWCGPCAHLHRQKRAAALESTGPAVVSDEKRGEVIAMPRRVM